MVEHLIKHAGAMKTKLMLQGIAVIMGVIATGPVGAEPLLDPTRPPGAAMSGENGGEIEPAGPVLQSVMLSSGRKMAVISGQAVRVGEKFGDATLVRVSDQEAVLRAGDGAMQVLKMYPAVEKTVRKPTNARRAENRKAMRPLRNTR